MEDIFERDLNGEMVSLSDPGYDGLINAIWDTMKTADELNDGHHTPDEVRRILGKIIGQEVDESVTLLPPFYVDYGKHIEIGKGCFIQQCCTFFGRGGITLGENVLVGPKVNIITINHDPDPENRSATYGRPVVIGDNVWIGINSTILPGVSIGCGAIIGANSVVTKDVPPMTVVAGNPARIIKTLKNKHYERGEQN
ncbi:MAG: sugar O-acetyltransferase [Alistipes sp.]|uniref:sugar O-acetyltransferase n=1 Tax=Alistipes sp. TaxID=1872444 RepID=UPI0025C536B5|nr:sugar O-acetyltransferase [Alistipes sp.]MCD8274126.1 sugar O-acetyltransferase [Alistipes sp.]